MITITEVKENDGYVYDVTRNGIKRFIHLDYDAALERANELGRPVEIVYLSGNKPNFNDELSAKRQMDAKGW
jgi:hypothetical protein